MLFRRIEHAALASTVATTATTLASVLFAHVQRELGFGVERDEPYSRGDEDAGRANEFDLKHTVAGAVLNTGAMGSWAALHELAFGTWARRSKVSALVAGAATSALAYVTDYKLVPKRLTPGFELRFSPQAIFATYAVLAGALALSSLMQRSENA
ncbi:MAG: hypothetical protein IPK60_25045 [Sandaracinaceae bacterium]|nr:hypothetical protein [Sandaracinaceae bacterium]